MIGLLVIAMVNLSIVSADPTALVANGVNLVRAIQENPRMAVENVKIEKAKLNLESARSAEISIESTRETFKKYGIDLEPEEALEFDLIQYTTYKRADLGVQLTAMGSQITKNAVELGMRELYLGTYSAKLSLAVQEQKLLIANKKLALEVQKQKKGVSTALAVKDLAQGVKLAKLERDKVQLQLTRLSRQLQQMAGQGVLLEAQKYAPDTLQIKDYYLAQMDNRMEVKSLKLQNDMDTLVLPYYEKDKRLTIQKNKTTYDQTVARIGQRNLQIKVAKLKLDQELERAIQDISGTVRQEVSLKAQLKLLENQMANVKTMVSKGLVPALQLEEMSVGQMELKNAIQLVQMQYNLKRIKLNYATSVGPAY